MADLTEERPKTRFLWLGASSHKDRNTIVCVCARMRERDRKCQWDHSRSHWSQMISCSLFYSVNTRQEIFFRDKYCFVCMFRERQSIRSTRMWTVAHLRSTKIRFNLFHQTYVFQKSSECKLQISYHLLHFGSFHHSEHTHVHTHQHHQRVTPQQLSFGLKPESQLVADIKTGEEQDQKSGK